MKTERHNTEGTYAFSLNDPLYLRNPFSRMKDPSFMRYRSLTKRSFGYFMGNDEKDLRAVLADLGSLNRLSRYPLCYLPAKEGMSVLQEPG